MISKKKINLRQELTTEKDFLKRQKEFGNKVNEFQFSCKQVEESTTSPLSGLVFSVASAQEAFEKHKMDTAQQMQDLEGKFTALQEASFAVLLHSL